MSIYDDYITGDDKPFAENINDALLLSNVFNFNVPVSLPSDFTNGEWINNTTQRKAGVSIIQLPEGLPNTLTVNGDKITGTGTMKLLVYPNFNSFGKFYRITWESENSNIQVNLKTKNGTMIAQNINNGLITSTSVELQKLQQILVEVVFTASDTLTGLVITMQNKIKDDRHTVDLGMSSVTGLEDDLNSLESNLNSLNSNVTQKISNLNTEVWGSNTQTGNSRIDSLNTNYNNLRSSITNLESSVASLDTRVNNFYVGYAKVVQLSSSVWTGGNNLFLFRMGNLVVAFIPSAQLKYTSTGWKDMATLPTGYRPIMNTPLAVINNSTETFSQWKTTNNVLQVYCATANSSVYTGCLGVWVTPDDTPHE